MIFLVFIMVILFSFCIGFSLVIKPAIAIEIQRRFYASINWKIEPVSMQKEIRNTRIMGWFLIVFLIATLFFIIAKRFCLPKI